MWNTGLPPHMDGDVATRTRSSSDLTQLRRSRSPVRRYPHGVVCPRRPNLEGFPMRTDALAVAAGLLGSIFGLLAMPSKSGAG